MKKIISYMVVVVLTITSIAGLPIFFEEGQTHAADQTANQVRYHLDMGVYVVAKVNGKWADGIAYNTVQTYKATAQLPMAGKVTRVMSLAQAQSERINLWEQPQLTSYIPCKSSEKIQQAYFRLYDSYVSPNITNVKLVSNKGNSVQFSIKAQLKGQSADYNIIKKYEARAEKTFDVQKIVVKDNQTTTAIKELLEEKVYLYKAISGISSAGATDEQKAAYKRYQQVIRQLDALNAKPNYTTIDKVVQSYKLDEQSFINEVYKFWGGPSGLQSTNANLYAMMKNIEKGTANLNDEYYLVFLPTVIEYQAEEVITPQPEQVTPPPDTNGNCTDVIKWSEIKDHSYTVGEKTYTCHHVYTYQTSLTSSATLTAAKPNGNSTTFKSGYGFKVAMNNTINTKQIGNAGACGQNKSKANDKKPVPPQSAEVKNTWSVKLKDSKVTQPQTVALVKGSATATTANFITGPNPLSPTKNALIYTDVALKGTKKAPVKHTIAVYAYGGGVNGVQFCKSIPLTFIINGNMYEDDWTVDGR